MPTEDVGQDDPLQYSTATIGALTHLLTQIDSATSTLSSNLTPESYAALAALPLSYPWSNLVLDLKDLLPILDRYVLSCLLASSAAAGEPLQNDLCHCPNSPNTAPATKNDRPKSQRNLLKTDETSFPMRGRSENDPSMKPSVRNLPRNRGYISRPSRAVCIELCAL